MAQRCFDNFFVLASRNFPRSDLKSEKRSDLKNPKITVG